MQEYRPFFFDIYFLFYIYALFYHFPVNNAKFFLIFCIISTLVRKMKTAIENKGVWVIDTSMGKKSYFMPHIFINPMEKMQ